MGYYKDALKGLSWMGGLRVSNRLIVFVKTAILARILSPSQFGVFGIATLVLAFLEVFTETGINIVLVQKKEDIDKYIDSAWIVSILRGIVISLIMLIFAPVIALFFRSPESRNIVLLMAIIPLLRGLINPAIVKLQKDLMFRKEFLLRFAVVFMDTLFAVVLTIITKSTYALVWGMLAGTVVEIFLSWIIVSPKPKVIYDSIKVGEIVKEGKWVTFAGIFHYLFTNGDNIVVGRLLGEAPLGIYSNAYKISSLPISEVSDVFFKVTFPVYVKIADDVKRLKKAFLKSLATSSILVILIGIFIFVFPDFVVGVLLGPNWGDTVPVLKVLALFGIVKGILNPAYSLFLGAGKQNYLSYVTLLGIIAMGATIIPLTDKFGLIGTGYSVIFGSVAIIPLVVYYVGKILSGKI